MIEEINLLRNVGQFASVISKNSLKTVSIVYAENGRGKTTFATILRSLSTGDSSLITDRRRLGEEQSPHIVIKSNEKNHIFQNGTWTDHLPNIEVFDDDFIVKNVCSGMEIEADHRQNLHALILGKQGISLNKILKDNLDKIEEHNRNIKEREAKIPESLRGGLSVDKFCELPQNLNINAEIQEEERNIAAAKSSDLIKQRPNFQPLNLPSFDIEAINSVLNIDLPELQAQATDHVYQHLMKLGKDAEAWIEDGMQKISALDEEKKICPFCAQHLDKSSIISHYASYFSENYTSLKQTIVDQRKRVQEIHENDGPATFERSVSTAIQNAEFWRKFMEIPTIEIDTIQIARAWKDAKDSVLTILKSKEASPLEKMRLSSKEIDIIAAYDRYRTYIESISSELQTCNSQIALVKERAATANIVVLGNNLSRLKAVQVRYSQDIAPLCKDYIDEKNEKKITETERTKAQRELDQYCENIFKQYEMAINKYLKKFNAGFLLSKVTSAKNRGGYSCTYEVLINDIHVRTSENSGPSFKNTLSAGDRSSLALAFFFASLDQDPSLSQKIVVIDDPMTSLDEHRRCTTIQEIKTLVKKVKQVIILSHSKSFLCRIWDDLGETNLSALKITREGQSSAITQWDVQQDSITEHDKRYKLVSEYIKSNNSDKEREVAIALRFILESFLRVAYPLFFPRGTMLGEFLRSVKGKQILNEDDVNELHNLKEYVNKFHHDTNPTHASDAINDQELLNYCKRTLAFAQRKILE